METKELLTQLEELTSKLEKCGDNIECLNAASVLHTLAASIMIGHGSHFRQFCCEYTKEMQSALKQVKVTTPKTVVH